jgi:hypothetical protein
VQLALLRQWTVVKVNHLTISIGVGLLALAYFAVLLPRDITWVNVGYDGPGYLLAMRHLRITYPTGDPLYILLGAAWIRAFPFGTEWFRVALLSATFGGAAAGLLYYHTRSWLSPLVFLASGVVVSQAIVVEKYTLTTFLILLAYHVWSSDRRAWGYAILGLALAVHHTAGFFWLGFMWADYRNYRNWRLGALSVLVGLPWYLYIPLANRPPFLNIGGTGIGDYFKYCCSQSFLWGGLAVMDGRFSISPDFWGRVIDLARILLGGFGPALVVLYLAIREKVRAKAWLIPVLFGLVMLYYFTNLDPSVYTYTILAFALGALLIGEYSQPSKTLKAAVAVFCGIALVFNAGAYNIGGPTLDPYHSAEVFEAGLAQLPPDAMIWSNNRGWEKFTALRYNLDHGTTFDVLNIEQPRPSKAETYLKMDAAYQGGRLYRSRIVDRAHHLAILEPTTPSAVLADIDNNQWLRGWK